MKQTIYYDIECRSAQRAKWSHWTTITKPKTARETLKRDREIYKDYEFRLVEQVETTTTESKVLPD